MHIMNHEMAEDLIKINNTFYNAQLGYPDTQLGYPVSILYTICGIENDKCYLSSQIITQSIIYTSSYTLSYNEVKEHILKGIWVLNKTSNKYNDVKSEIKEDTKSYLCDNFKTIIIINGVGECGKDSLIREYEKILKQSVRNISSIDPIKDILTQTGAWDGSKTKKSRKMLSDLKKVFEEFNNTSSSYIKEETSLFLNSLEEIMFVHIRETEEIDKYIEYINLINKQMSEYDERAYNPLQFITLLVVSNRTNDIVYSNDSDDNVLNFNYDFVFENNKDLNTSGKSFFKAICGASKMLHMTGKKGVIRCSKTSI